MFIYNTCNTCWLSEFKPVTKCADSILLKSIDQSSISSIFRTKRKRIFWIGWVRKFLERAGLAMITNSWKGDYLWQDQSQERLNLCDLAGSAEVILFPNEKYFRLKSVASQKKKKKKKKKKNEHYNAIFYYMSNEIWNQAFFTIFFRIFHLFFTQKKTLLK